MKQQLSSMGEWIQVLRISRSAKEKQDLGGGQSQEGPQIQNTQVAQ